MLLKSLKYKVKHEKDCQRYYQQNGVLAAPVPPDEIELHQYWNNPSKIMKNHMIECVLMKCEEYGNLVGATNRDIITNYDSLNEFELNLSALIGLSLDDFKIDEDIDMDERKDVELGETEQTKKEVNPMAIFMKNVGYDEDRKVSLF